MHELQYWDSAIFTTLTYAAETLPADTGLHKKEMQLFLKRLRKLLGDKKIKYYLCGEYGDISSRPHYHAIIFGLELGTYYNSVIQSYNSENDVIEKAWGFGNVYNGTVTKDSARYCADYVFKKYNGAKKREVYGDLQAPFQLFSKGLGERFVLEHKARLSKDLSFTVDGVRQGLPKYYKLKLNIPDDLRTRAREREREAYLNWCKEYLIKFELETGYRLNIDDCLDEKNDLYGHCLDLYSQEKEAQRFPRENRLKSQQGTKRKA